MNTFKVWDYIDPHIELLKYCFTFKDSELLIKLYNDQHKNMLNLALFVVMIN